MICPILGAMFSQFCHCQHLKFQSLNHPLAHNHLPLFNWLNPSYYQWSQLISLGFGSSIWYRDTRYYITQIGLIFTQTLSTSKLVKTNWIRPKFMFEFVFKYAHIFIYTTTHLSYFYLKLTFNFKIFIVCFQLLVVTSLIEQNSYVDSIDI